MTFGATAKKIAAAAWERGLQIPDDCLPPIVVNDHQSRLLEAFWELSSSRQIHMAGAGPIPWDVADAYAQRHGFADDPELYDDFMCVIRALDAEFIIIQSDDFMQRQAAAERKRGR